MFDNTHAICLSPQNVYSLDIIYSLVVLLPKISILAPSD